MIISSLGLLLAILSIVFGREEILEFEIKNPSGILVDRVQSPTDGSIYRFGRLRHSILGVRPQWSGIHVIEDIFTPEETASIIAKAEAHAAEHGWSKARHVDYAVRPTKDLPIRDLYPTPEEYEWLDKRLKERIFDKFAIAYKIDQSFLSIDDLFITKYSSQSSTENALAPHQDKSPWSFVITLNDNFEKGGTYFVQKKRVWKGPVGSVLIFHGYQLHGAYEISKGDRYILAGFCNYGSDSHEEFMKSYSPYYDGYAGKAGFKSGDLIIGVSYCYEVPDPSDTSYTNAAVTATGETVPVEEGKCVANASGHKQKMMTVKEMRNITLYTTDEEWTNIAQSCERLMPSQKITMRVKRHIKD